jgi:ABC-type antimicrobial peptide transport system permease subunit
MYLPQAQLADSFLVLVVRMATSRPERVVPAVRDVVRRLDNNVPIYDVASLETLVAKAAGRQRFVMRLLAGFAGIALLLAAIGLYGVIAYSVARRSREVGLRMALGATPRDVMRLVLSGGAGVIGAGLAAGLIATLLVTRFLETLLFGVEATDISTLVAATAVLIAVALAAHFIPLRRALRIDPASALRQEL